MLKCKVVYIDNPHICTLTCIQKMPPAVLSSEHSEEGNERVELKFNKVQMITEVQLRGAGGSIGSP